MGGCRCTFRGCENSTFTAKQGTHFFHFPVRDMERCTKWAEMSNNMHFLKLPSDKLKNKVVCEIHFRDPCFMNYKKERLIKTAVPTLMRLKSGEICDLEVQEPIEEVVTKQSEPPAPTRFPVILNRKRPLNQVTKFDSPKNSKDMISISSDAGSDIGLEVVSKPKIIKLVARKTAINNLNLTPVSSIPKSLSPSASVTTTSATSTSHNKKQPILLNGNFITTTGGLKYVNKSYNKRNKDTIIYDQESQKSYITLENNDINLNDTLNDPEAVVKIETIDRTKINIERDDTPNSSTSEIINENINEAYLRKIVDEHSKQMEDLKQLLREKVANENLISINQSKESSPRIGEKSLNMNKTQLFNGIKRYLNPSMVALLRMEIFGAPEREWKPDEKQISTELLKLGPNVYEYIRDEWRFRLPPKKDVDNWIKAEDTAVSNNDEQDDC